MESRNHQAESSLLLLLPNGGNGLGEGGESSHSAPPKLTLEDKTRTVPTIQTTTTKSTKAVTTVVTTTTTTTTAAAAVSTTLQVPGNRRVSSAHTKRCRFALSNGNTKPSSPGPVNKGERRSRSPGPKPRTLKSSLVKPIPSCRPPLSLEEAEDVILTAATGRTLPKGLAVLGTPPQRPRGGFIYLHRSETGNREWKNDGYEWTEVLFQSALPTTRGNTLDYHHFYVQTASGGTSSKFRRETYGMGSLTLVSYIGDPDEAFNTSTATVLKALPPPPSIVPPLPLPAFSLPTTSPATTTTISTSTTTAVAMKYQDRYYLNLSILAEELASGKFVKNLTIFPSLQITVIHPDMTRQFEHCCRLLYVDRRHAMDVVGLKLFYDITFPIGDVYATLLTFANSCYEGNPIMPLAVNIHERKFKSSHQLFWARVLGDIPALQKYRFPLMIDDAEPAVHLAVRSQAPNLVQLEGWTHRFRDIDSHMRQRGYGDEAVSYYKACVAYLLKADSKQCMHERYRREFEGIWPLDFVQYYKDRVLPRSGRLGKWAMAMANITEPQYLSPHVNPQERFHILCRHFSSWDSLKVDQLVRAFYLLFAFHVAESNSTQSRIFVIKSEFRPSFTELIRDRPRYCRPPDPADIVAFVKQNYPDQQRQMEPHNRRISRISVFPENVYDYDDYDDIYDPYLWKLWESSSSARNSAKTTTTTTTMMTEVIAGFSTEDDDDDPRKVPSPAPNGRVPSPAPAAAASFIPPSFHPPIPVRLHHVQQQQLQLQQQHQQQQQQQQQHVFIPPTSGLSTIPEISLEKHQLSMDSSIVTEGHYDASFESENDHYNEDACTPRAPPPPAPSAAVTTNPTTIVETMAPTTTSSAIISVTSVKTATSTTATTSKTSSEATLVPSGLMLWKKVQHCVVFGSSFVPKRVDV